MPVPGGSGVGVAVGVGVTVGVGVSVGVGVWVGVRVGVGVGDVVRHDRAVGFECERVILAKRPALSSIVC